MDQTFLLALVVALIVALAALGRLATRPSTASQGAAEPSYGTSTEGMKVCPKCAMGNLWMERTCINCGTRFKG